MVKFHSICKGMRIATLNGAPSLRLHQPVHLDDHVTLGSALKLVKLVARNAGAVNRLGVRVCNPLIPCGGIITSDEATRTQ